MNRLNWCKRATILLSAVCVALVALSSFAAKAEDNWLVRVEGLPISREMYCYFYSQALAGTEKDKQGQPKDPDAVREDAKRRCAAYVAVNSELHNRRKFLNQAMKVQAAERTAYLWRVFHAYYTSVGVSKQTLNAALAGEAAKNQLFLALYDAGGTFETPEDSIKSYFYGNFVAYEGLRVLYTKTEADGTERPMTAPERAFLLVKMKAFVAQLNSPGAPDFYELAEDNAFAADLSYAMPDVAVIQKGVDMPDEAFEKVRGLDPQKVALLELPGYVLVARGFNMRTDEESYYQGYRDACLRALKGGAFEANLQELYKAYRAEENVAAVDEVIRNWGKESS